MKPTQVTAVIGDRNCVKEKQAFFFLISILLILLVFHENTEMKLSRVLCKHIKKKALLKRRHKKRLDLLLQAYQTLLSKLS